MAFKASLQLALLVATAAAVPASVSRRASSGVNTATINGQTYVYESLAGYGYTASNSRDKFGDTAGGLGSSAAIDPSSWKKSGSSYTGVLWALPDRGWNTEGTTNYQPRVHKFAITFTPNDSATVSDPSPPNLQLEYLDSILFTDPAGAPITGLDSVAEPPYLSFETTGEVPTANYTGDGFGGSGSGGRRVSGDTEGLVVNSDGSFWVSDEYGPSIFHFSSSGQLLSSIKVPDALIPRRNDQVSFSANSPPVYDPDLEVDPSKPESGRNNNQGFEGLTASPDGKTLYILLQSAAIQDGGTSKTTSRYTRFLQYDVSDPLSPVYEAEYVVPLPVYGDEGTTAAQSEVKYISDTQFLVLARDSDKGHGQGADNTESVYRHVDVFDISSATNIKGTDYDSTTGSIATDGELNADITPATFASWLDFNVNSELGKFGAHNGGDEDSNLLNEKWESLALVPVEPETAEEEKQSWGNWGSWGRWGGSGHHSKRSVSSNEYFLFSLSDNDFITQDGYENFGQFPYSDSSGYDLSNQVLVFKVQLPSGSKPRVG
ncbi:hypothetical protein DV735_g3776, partial [Chaetothyriales sp. CBS 134920]